MLPLQYRQHVTGGFKGRSNPIGYRFIRAVLICQVNVDIRTILPGGRAILWEERNKVLIGFEDAFVEGTGSFKKVKGPVSMKDEFEYKI